MSGGQHGEEQEQPARSSLIQSGVRWGEDIRQERLSELEGALRQWFKAINLGAPVPPLFRGKRLTGAEVFWLAAIVLAGPVGDASVAADKLRAPVDVRSPVYSSALKDLHLEGALLQEAHLENAVLPFVHFEGAILFEAHLEGALLNSAHFEGAVLHGAHLKDADLDLAHLEGAILIQTHLEGARLNGASFDKASHLNGAALDGVVLDQVVFDNTNLAVVDWTQVRRLGDERVASTATNRFGGPKDRLQWLRDAEGSVRAYRQLAVALRNQGMIEHADRFAYRARILERRLFARKRQIGQYVFATFLALLAGYGYRPSRSILSYLVVITAFATVYYAIGPTVGVPLPPLGALVFSMTSFHGRGFFPGGSPGHSITLDDPLTVIAACEAVVGLVMEITFFATFTQRLFGK